jgi:hypothetical protein
MRCPKCKNRLLQKSGRKTRLRTQGPLMFNGDGKCLTKCYWCGEPVEVPLELRKGTVVQGERYVISSPEPSKT